MKCPLNLSSPDLRSSTGANSEMDRSEREFASLKIKRSSLLGYGAEVFTGLRPTGNLTIANYLGALEPVIALQERGLRPLVFVADLHAYTDNEPSTARQHTGEVIAACLAAGLDPTRTMLFTQSSIAGQVYDLTMLLTRHLTLSELARVPTIKDKIEDGGDPLSINLMLAMYPVMMASDIMLQRGRLIPTGQDQIPHLELTKRLARRFNERYGDILPLPEPVEHEPLRIRSLDGEGKMSKGRAKGAIFLSDSEDEIRSKISRAKTAFAGEMNDNLKSLAQIGRSLAGDTEAGSRLESILDEHVRGAPVLGHFKRELAEVVVNFIKGFQERRSEALSTPGSIESALEAGTALAKRNADETLQAVHTALGI